MKKKLPKITLYVAILLTVFVAQSRLTKLAPRNAVPQNGFVDLSDADLAREPVRIAPREWEYYPGRLLTPADFAQGAPAAPLFGDNDGQADYGTYRLRVKLPPGRVYALTGRSFPFAQRVFLDGGLMDETGTPGTSREDTRPHSKTYDYHFMPERDVAELIFQVANFHHREGARNASVTIALPPAAARLRALEFIGANLVLGCMVTAFLYLIGMFVFFPRRRYFLFLALACLTMAVRMTFLGEKHVMAVFPELDWFFAIRAEYLCLVLFVSFLLLYFHSLYPGMLRPGFVLAIVGLSALYGLIILFGNTLLFTSLLFGYTLVWTAAAAVTLWKMVLQLRRGDLHTTLIFTGLMVFVATAVFDEAAYRFVLHERAHHTIIAGVLVCVFMNMLALTLDLSEIESALVEAKSRQRELDEANRLLDRLGVMKGQFMANISHEMKTPLTVMSVHAQLSKALLESGANREEIVDSIDTITRESARLARMVGGVLDLESMQENRAGMAPLDAGLLTRKCAEAYQALFERRGNALQLQIADEALVVDGDADMLTQVLFNLFSNANRHTENGVIAVSAETCGDTAAITVRDSGSGVPEELLPRVFDRRVREDEGGGTGLGLTISKSIVKRHGGEIAMERVREGGTQVRFTLPLASKDKA